MKKLALIPFALIAGCSSEPVDIKFHPDEVIIVESQEHARVILYKKCDQGRAIYMSSHNDTLAIVENAAECVRSEK